MINELGNQSLRPRFRDRQRLCLAQLPPSIEVPLVRESGALSGFHRVNAAAAVLQHDAFVVLLLDQRKAVAVRPQAGEAGDELFLRHPQMGGDRPDLVVLDPHVARPLAAGGAALADLKDVGIQQHFPVAGAAVRRLTGRDHPGREVES